MLSRARDRAVRTLHNWRCCGIFATPPLAIKPAPLIFCSMVSQRDLTMYLVAIKSIYSRIGEGGIHIINDGTLTSENIDLLRHHLGSPTIIDIATIDTGKCPRGGTWERLLHLLDLARHDYVIQVDSDLLARSEISEVAQCYRENRSFTLGSWAGQDFVTLAQAAEYARGIAADHIQIAAESIMDRLSDGATRRYVRDSSGFAVVAMLVHR